MPSATPFNNKPAVFENPLVPNAKLKQLYVLMLKSRMFAERMVRDAKQRRTDRLVGHEASRVAIALGLRKGDIAVPVPSDHVVPIAAGTSMRDMVNGHHHATRDSVRIVAALTKDANQFAFACGLAMARRETEKTNGRRARAQREEEGNVVVAFGDEATRETLTYAAQQKLPVI